MNTDSDLPQVYTVGHPATRDVAPIHNTTTRTYSDNDVCASSYSDNDASAGVYSDSPPEYSSIYGPTDIANTKKDIEAAPTNVHQEKSDILDTEPLFFEDKAIRTGFIQKVLAVKSLQLLGMCSVMLIFRNFQWDINRVLSYSRDNTILIILSIVGFTVTTLVTFVWVFGRNDEETRRKNPFRYMFLVIHPLRISAVLSICTIPLYLLGSCLLVCTYYLAIVIALLIYSLFVMQSEHDFLPLHGILVAFFTQIVMYALTVPFINVNPSFILYGVVLLTPEILYILYDMDAMTSKKYWRSTPTDFIDGATNLQIDDYMMFRITLYVHVLLAEENEK